MPLILDITPPPGCLVRFISDLHLGHKRGTAPSPAELVGMMEGVGMLVLCGDTVELRMPGETQQKSLALREELRRLCATRGIQLIELAGNHDPATEPMLARFWGGRVAAMHGHSVPDAVSPWSREYLVNAARVRELIAAHPASRSQLTARLELSRLIAEELARLDAAAAASPQPRKRSLLHELYHCFWPPGRPLRIVWNWITCGHRAERWLRRYLPETEVFIFGHFHRGGKWRYGRRTLLNTGAWFEHATPYAVDMVDARLLRYFKLNAAEKSPRS